MNVSSPIKEPVKVFSPVNDAEAQTFINTWCETCSRPSRNRDGFLIR